MTTASRQDAAVRVRHLVAGREAVTAKAAAREMHEADRGAADRVQQVRGRTIAPAIAVVGVRIRGTRNRARVILAVVIRADRNQPATRGAAIRAVKTSPAAERLEGANVVADSRVRTLAATIPVENGRAKTDTRAVTRAEENRGPIRVHVTKILVVEDIRVAETADAEATRGPVDRLVVTDPAMIGIAALPIRGGSVIPAEARPAMTLMATSLDGNRVSAATVLKAVDASTRVDPPATTATRDAIASRTAPLVTALVGIENANLTQTVARARPEDGAELTRIGIVGLSVIVKNRVHALMMIVHALLMIGVSAVTPAVERRIVNGIAQSRKDVTREISIVATIALRERSGRYRPVWSRRRTNQNCPRATINPVCPRACGPN